MSANQHDHITFGFQMTDIDLYDPLIGEVSENAFKDRKNIVKVYFPVAWEIGESAFNGCSEIR